MTVCDVARKGDRAICTFMRGNESPVLVMTCGSIYLEQLSYLANMLRHRPHE